MTWNTGRSQPPTSWEETQQVLPSGSSGGANSVNTLSQTCSLQNNKKIHFCSLSLSVHATLWTPQKTDTSCNRKAVTHFAFCRGPAHSPTAPQPTLSESPPTDRGWPRSWLHGESTSSCYWTREHKQQEMCASQLINVSESTREKNRPCSKGLP